ncbi:MAG: B12-binding domain-containing radical SAM protein, partial [Minisyncoccia bacterium]
MRILLIDPPFYRFIGYYNRYFPLGLAYLAAILRDKGHQVLIYDADCNQEATKMEYSLLEESYPEYIAGINNPNHKLWQEAREVIENFKPDLVGITMMTTKVASAFRLAEICKDYNKNLPVVVGGPHPTLMPDEVLKNSPAIDIILRGEGEKSFPNLIKAIQSQKPLETVNGISFRKENRVIHNLPEEPIMNLDSLPFPARDLLWGKETYTSEDMGLLFASRACPYNCTFCSSAGIWGRITRCRSIPNIIAEIKEVQKTYGTVQFSFKDDTFTLDRRRVIEFCQTLKKEKIKINWDCNGRINLLDKELLKIMKEAGC